MAREGVLFTLGNPLLDISAEVDNEFLNKYGLEANCAVLAEPHHKPLLNDLCEKFQVNYVPGGATQNTAKVAQWVIQHPGAVVYSGCIGTDRYAQILEERIHEIGVKALYQRTDKEGTGTCAVLLTGRNRSLVADLGAAKMYTKEFLMQPESWSYVTNASYYYIAGFPLTVCPEAVFAIAEHSAANDKIFVLNLAAPFLCLKYQEPMDHVLPYVDILFANEQEATAFSQAHNFNTTDLKEMALLASKLPKANPKRSRIVVFTYGSKPAVLVQDGVVTEFPVHLIPAEKIVDTNGAGDAFVGGFLAQLIQGRSLTECMKSAHYAANVIIQNLGCTFPKTCDFKL